MSAVAEPTPIETLRQRAQAAHAMTLAHDGYFAECEYPGCAAARKALESVAAVVAFAQRIGYDEELSYLACPGPPNCGGAGAHYDSCPVAQARAALVGKKKP